MNLNHRSIVFLICLLIASSFSAETGPNQDQSLPDVSVKRWERKEPESKLTLIVELTRMMPKRGEIEGHILLRNDSTKAISIFTPGVLVSIQQQGDLLNGSLPPLPLTMSRPPSGNPSDYFKLLPGETFGRKFFVEKFPPCHFTLSGFYKESLNSKKYLLIVESSTLELSRSGNALYEDSMQ